MIKIKGNQMRNGQFYDKLSDLNDNLYHIKNNFADWKIIFTGYSFCNFRR